MNQDNFFQELDNTRPFIKMGIKGFAGDGKTFTAALIAIGLHKKIGSMKPVVVYDTERRFRARKQAFDDAGIGVKIRESRSLADLVTTFDWCEKGYSDIIIIDSITHVWENFVEAFKIEKHVDRLAFQHWGILKPEWKKKFSERFQMIPVHVIFTGRSGWEYDYEETEEVTKAGKPKMELRKSGVKMKAESETEFEPDIVLTMEKEMEFDGKKSRVINHKCTVIKDGWDIIDGKQFDNPTFADFVPVFDAILSGQYQKSDMIEEKDTFAGYDDDAHDKAKLKRKIFIEEIEGLFTQIAPGSSKEEKLFKADVSEIVFNTRSWRAIEVMNLDQLEAGKFTMVAFKDKFRTYADEQAQQGLGVNYKEAISMLYKIESMTDRDNPSPSTTTEPEPNNTGGSGSVPASEAPGIDKYVLGSLIKLLNLMNEETRRKWLDKYQTGDPATLTAKQAKELIGDIKAEERK